jgi:hypothetical protein
VGTEDDSRLRARLELCERTALKTRARSTGNEFPQKLHAAVFGVAEQDFVAVVQIEGARDDVDRRARVRYEDEVARWSMQVCGESLPRMVEQLGNAPLAPEHLDRLAFDLPLPALVLVEYRRRARAERPVIQEHDVRIEEKKLAQLAED